MPFKTVRKLIILLVILATLVPGELSYFLSAPQKVSAATNSKTTRADFTTGFFTNTEAITKEGEIKLKGDGTWNARVWRTPFLTLNDGTAFTNDGTYTYMLIARDTRFVRYIPDEDRWQELATAPHMSYSGADMTKLGDYIYVSFGGYQKEFSRYSLIDNTWTDLENFPELLFSGSSLANDGTNIYALRGAVTADFWKYTPATDTWSTVTAPPATISTGADLVFDDSTGTDYLYTPRGANTTTFYRYNISANTWSTMAVAPGTLNDNGNISKRGDYIYVLRGSATATFYRYRISTDTWSTISNTPIANRYVGLTYNAHEDLLYVFRGNNTYDWWKYDADTDTFIGPADLPATPGSGADVTYNNGYIYYRRGNNSTSYYRFNISTGAWTTLTVSPAAVNDDTKGISVGSYLYYFRAGATNTFYRYTPASDTWTTMGNAPATVSYGSSLVYPGSGDYIYGTRGGLTNTFWRYSIQDNTWADTPADLPVDSEVGYGSRLISDGTDVYSISGSGIAKLLKYTVATDTWSVLGDVPFAPYWGTDAVYYNNKIYVQSGYYKTDFWEYTISSNTWRRLPNMAGYYAQDIGPYNGGSIGADTSNGVLYSISGANLVRLLTFTPTATNYPTSGTWTSETIDLSYVNEFTSLSATTQIPGNSSITFETRTSANKSSWTSWEAVSGGTISSTAQRYIQVRATLNATVDRTQTPTLQAVTVTYTGDETAPTNPGTFNGLSRSVGGTALVSGDAYTHASPYFTWSGASDAETSISGYYVYFGTSSSADPESLGTYQTTTNYTVTLPMSAGTYYLRFKTKDTAGNISSAVTGFTYVYNGVSPPQTNSYTNSDDFTGTAENVSVLGDQIKLASTSGFWQQERLSLAPSTFNYGASFAYVEEDSKLYTFRGINTNTFYEYDITSDTWTTLSVAPAAVYQGGDIVEGPSGYLFATPGRGLNSFWKYDIEANSWSTVQDSPLSFYYGSALIYDGEQYIYALRGNTDDAFMRYDTLADTWETLANTDFGAPSVQINNNVYIGGDLTFDRDSTLYAIQGNTLTGFASYNISSNTWSQLPNLPVIPYDGSQISYDSTSNAIYYISGWTNPFLYKYDLTTQTWSTLQNAPAPFGAGATMRNVDGVLYFLRGASTNTLWKYTISKASWHVPTVGLFGTEFRGTDYRPFGYGANIVKGNDDYYYLVRGNYDNLFVRYDESSGEVVDMANPPNGFYIGGTLEYDSEENKIYAIASLYVPKLYVYDIETDSWTEETQDPLPADPGAGSSLAYDGERYLYWIRGGSSNATYRYDTQADAGSRWTQMANGPSTFGAGAELVYYNNYLYATRGNTTVSFYRYDINANTWSDPAVSDLPAGVTFTTDGFLVYGGNGIIYGCRGANTATCYQYTVGTDTWSAIENAPGQINQGGSGASNGSNRLFMIPGNGTNTYANGLYSYVIQSSDSSFEESGEYTSQTHDLGTVYRFANLQVEYTAQPNTTLSVETRSSPDNSEWSSWTDTTEEKQLGTTYYYKVNSSVNRYLQVRFTLNSSDGLYSGSIGGYTINTYQDSDAPINPTSVLSYSSATLSASLTSNNWYNHSAPHFDWPEAEESNGASDTSTGSGVSGYYVYFGTDALADPEEDGVLQSGSSYTASSLTSGSTYYLRIKTEDDAGNISSSTWQPFIYKFDNVAPTNPTTVVSDPPGYSSTNLFNFTWSGATDSASEVSQYCYKAGISGSETCVASSSASSITASQTGTNTFYVRAKDTAGNYAGSYVNASYYYSSTAPSSPQNLEVSPSSNTVNEFAFSWNPPSLYYGAQSGLRYYYSINSLPTAQSVNSVGLTNSYLSAGSYATLPGVNTFYVVAKDEAGNIDYNNYSSVSFTADTSAPGIPADIDIADVSVKSTSTWRLAISWNEPTDVGSGVSSYKVYQSTTAGASCTDDLGQFSSVASTTGESYVATGLAQQTYYYCATACDSTNNCSAPSDTVALLPDGKWTSEPELVASPSATVNTKSATVTWSTDRTSNSFIKYGTSSNDYDNEVGSSDQVTAHSITITGLEPGTTYYYRAIWTDEDGNSGESDEITFTTNPAPFISGVKVTNISLYTANVSFTVKNATTANIKYGKTTAYGGIETISVSKSESTQTVALSNLTEGTVYHLQITAEDEEANEFSGDDYTFTTLPVPRITNLRTQQVAGMATATLRLLWNSNALISSIVTYYPTANPEAAVDQISLALKRSHEVILKNLKDNTDYTIVIKGKDSAGNEATAPIQNVQTAVDFRAPEIQNMNVESTIIGVGDEARAQIIVTWDTDEPATTQVEYAQGTGTTYGQSTQEDSNLTTNHSVTIPGLIPSRIYHLRAVSKDKSSNVSNSFDTVIVTPKSTKAALDLVIDNLSKTFGFLRGTQLTK